nr:hypothetical protein [Tanacetum cinerariifolium]
MRLKSKSRSLPVDSSSSSPMVLVTQSGNTRRSSTPQLKTSRPCYNFTRVSCRFGDTCSGVSNNGGSSTNELLVKILGQLGITGSNNMEQNHINGTLVNTLGDLSTPSAQTTQPVAYYTSVSPSGFMPSPAHTYNSFEPAKVP